MINRREIVHREERGIYMQYVYSAARTFRYIRCALTYSRLLLYAAALYVLFQRKLIFVIGVRELS